MYYITYPSATYALGSLPQSSLESLVSVPSSSKLFIVVVIKSSRHLHYLQRHHLLFLQTQTYGRHHPIRINVLFPKFEFPI